MTTLQTLLEERDQLRAKVREALDAAIEHGSAAAIGSHAEAVAQLVGFQASPTDDPLLLGKFRRVEREEDEIRKADVRASASAMYAEIAALPPDEQVAMGVRVPDRQGADVAAAAAAADIVAAKRSLAAFLCSEGAMLPELARQAGVNIAPFTVVTTGELDDLQLTGSTTSGDELAELLHYETVAVEDRQGNGIVYARNQDGVLLELMLDMDEQTPVVRPVCLTPAGVMDLNACDALVEESGMRP